MYKVFLVEDETAVRQAIRDTINWQSEDFEICGDAADGESALPLLLEKKPDILLTDIRMPFMDGLELVRIIAKELPKTIIIILSGYDEFTYAQKAIRLGVSDYLLKPITPAKLIQSLNNAINKIEDQQDKIRKQMTIERSRETSPASTSPKLMPSGQNNSDSNLVDRDAITDFLRFGNKADIRAFATELATKSCEVTKESQLGFYYCVFDVLTTAYKVAKDLNISLSQIKSYEQIASDVTTKEAFAELIDSLFTQMINARYSMADKSIQLIMNAKNYIDINYSDSELSLGKVCGTLGISSNYLSVLFSKETGETFSEYLNKVRIKNAMILLKSTDIRVADIAERVGYNDQHYFSKTFKKIIGLTPREYKNL